jgi:hypothetical protein
VAHIASLALVLQLHNLAGAPPTVVDTAAIELSRAYAQLGIQTEWRDADASADTPVVEVVVLAHETGLLRRSADTVMGAAVRTPTGAGIAYVFFERVRSEAERYGASTALVLAAAMAHEVGHLLLPQRGHSRDGLMRACWTREDFQRADQGLLRFSSEQAALVRAASASLQLPVEDERGDRARR